MGAPSGYYSLRASNLFKSTTPPITPPTIPQATPQATSQASKEDMATQQLGKFNHGEMAAVTEAYTQSYNASPGTN